MSFLEKLNILRWFESAGSDSRRLYIIDGDTVVSEKGGRSKLSPREQIDLLKALSRFAKKEGIAIFTVFSGKELRKVEHKGMYGEVKVFFAGQPDDFKRVIMQLLKQNGRREEVMVITSDKNLEKAVMDSGGVTMRASTFKKALDAISGGGSSRGKSRGRGKSRRRPRRDGSRGKSQPRQKKQKDTSPKDTVHQLIDVVETPPKKPADAQPEASGEDSSGGEKQSGEKVSEQPKEQEG